MKILTNKYFILGNLLLLLISIPITLFFISKQQELRSKAAPSSRLSFSPENPTTSTQCQSFNLDIMVDPGSNVVSIVDFYLKYDPAQLDVLQIKESSQFPTVVRPASITSGSANMSVSIGGDVTQAVQSLAKVATITFRPKTSGTAQITFDQDKSRVFSISPSDQPTENVLFQVSPANITIGQNTCPTGNLSPTPGATGSVQPTTAQITPTSRASSNIAPVCTSISVSPSSSGSAPLSVSFTARGNDPDTTGTIEKASYDFGDGQTQDITTGLGQKSVTAQTSHTYQSGGNFTATAVFTDNIGALSNACSQVITASGSATITPTSSQSSQLATAAPTQISSEPTIAPTGDLAKTMGIIGAIMLTIVGGAVLLAL